MGWNRLWCNVRYCATLMSWSPILCIGYVKSTSAINTSPGCEHEVCIATLSTKSHVEFDVHCNGVDK